MHLLAGAFIVAWALIAGRFPPNAELLLGERDCHPVRQPMRLSEREVRATALLRSRCLCRSSAAGHAFLCYHLLTLAPFGITQKLSGRQGAGTTETALTQ